MKQLNLKNITSSLFLLILSVFALFPLNAFAASAAGEEGSSLAIVKLFNKGAEKLVEFLDATLFFELGGSGFPFIVLWLITGGMFFSIILGFPNFRLFRHAISVVRGKYSKDDDPGEVTHFQALVAAVSGTVGLGNIAGVAIAVAVGGPGAIFWMMFAGFFGMSLKFAEVTMGHKYRFINTTTKVVSGGAFRYLEHGLANKGYKKLGKVLATLFAVCCVGAAFGSGNMFQASQSVKMVTHAFSGVSEFDWAIALVLAIAVGIVLLGGIKRVATTAEAIVPFMAIIYLSASLVVLFVNYDKIPQAFSSIFGQAFSMDAAYGGMIGAIIMGFRRATFSNEAGIGSAPIAHAPAKTSEPVRAGVVALLEPFIDTIVICMITGLVITTTGVYENVSDAGTWQGSMITSRSFETVIDWFPYILSVCVLLFAFSTMITWSYYGERTWEYLFGKGKRTLSIYHLLFCLAVFLGGTTSEVEMIVNLSDMMVFAMAIPNLIGLYMLSGEIRRDVKDYVTRLRTGKMPKTK